MVLSTMTDPVASGRSPTSSSATERRYGNENDGWVERHCAAGDDVIHYAAIAVDVLVENAFLPGTGGAGASQSRY